MPSPCVRAIAWGIPGGYGSQVVRSFPLAATAVSRPPQRIRVLVADDEPALRGALAELLAQEDRIFFVGAAADADEAIALAQREQPDVALLDVKPRPAEEDIVGTLTPNVCRCGTYPRILAAVKKAAQAMRKV